MQRAGHTNFQTTMGYIRDAENIRVGFGEVFPVLPIDALPAPLQKTSQTVISSGISSRGVVESETA